MRKQWLWMVPLVIIILFFSTFLSFSYASNDTDPSILNVTEKDLIERTTKIIDKKINEEKIKANRSASNKENKEQSYIEELFLQNNVDIGDSMDKLYSKMGNPNEEGMYEGGIYADYGKETFFINPDTNKINAIALPAEKIDEKFLSEVENSLKGNVIMEAFNEMENLWLEIYDWKSYNVMIERKEQKSSPIYIWLTEDSLFTQ
ncbi:hypothetical protein LGQ02_13665 [Bacillus shivajii]|uniref:hypothetical protein n=1 Tax=Bacillus shivajii TaxID=1983719 RepID=UPI001CFAB453|nr:hypothetical protein [Bacillus shivajii]UCZ51899.1 hypothetical protein LGQ02_13665 [Bacillus shivajii]